MGYCGSSCNYQSSTGSYNSGVSSSYTLNAASDSAALPESVASSLGISATYDAQGGYNSSTQSTSFVGTSMLSYLSSFPGEGDYSGTTPPEAITTPVKPGDLNPSIILSGSRPKL